MTYISVPHASLDVHTCLKSGTFEIVLIGDDCERLCEKADWTQAGLVKRTMKMALGERLISMLGEATESKYTPNTIGWGEPSVG